MIEILPMRSCHTDQVARLHLENLHTSFRWRPGHKLLALYYAAVAEETGGCGYVAINQDELVGYICGVWDAHELRKTLLRAHWFRLAFWGMIQILGKPSLISYLLGRFRSGKSANTLLEEMEDRDLYELRPIVVASKMRGSGLGSQLVARLINDARSRGYRLIVLITEDDNRTAQRFYEKIGFKEVGNRFMNGRRYLCFELDFSWMRILHES